MMMIMTKPQNHQNVNEKCKLQSIDLQQSTGEKE